MHHSSLRLPRPLGRALLAALCLGLLTLAPRPAAARLLDPDGNLTEANWVFVASDLTGMAWAPDGSGRLFVTRKSGTVRIVQMMPNGTGTLLPAVFATETVFTNSECGLIGIAFDPNFASNGYVYLFATVSNTEQRIIRYTATGNVGAGRLEVVTGLPTAGQNHDGGSLGVGHDGKLYWAIGDLGNGTGTQTSATVLPPLTTLATKVGRANRDGSAPNDNPFFDGPAGPNNDFIWARGFRNPFTMTFHPVTGDLWLDVVGDSYEQAFLVTRGSNAGYNFYEANQPEVAPYLRSKIKYRTGGGESYDLPTSSRSGGVTTFMIANSRHNLRQGERITVAGVANPSFNGDFYVASVPNVLNPRTFTVTQTGLADATSTGGTAAAQSYGRTIGGGVFYDGTLLPAAFRGNFFFTDFVDNRVMRAVMADPTTVASVDNLADMQGSALDVDVGPDGALYVMRYGGQIVRYGYTRTVQGLVLSGQHVRMDEGGTRAVTVRLATAPVADVTVSVARMSGDTDVTVTAGATLIFTAANFATPQVVRFAAADDGDTSDDAAAFMVTSAGLPAERIDVSVLDDDAQGLVVSSTTLTINEGAAGMFTVALAAAPAAATTVTVARSAGDTDVTVTANATMTFDAGNYNVPQVVMIAAAQDADNTDDAATLTISAPGLTSRTVAVTVRDDDARAPAFTSTPRLTAVVGIPYAYDANATGNPTPTYALAAGFPAGMTIDAATGFVNWTPTAAGTTSITVRALNGVAPDATQPFTITTTDDQPPVAMLTRPLPNDTVSGSATEFYGDGVDDVGAVRGEFRVDGVLESTDPGSMGHFHYNGGHLMWDTTRYSDGVHRLTFTVFDIKGQSGQREIDVTVANSTSPDGGPTSDAALSPDGGPVDAGTPASDDDGCGCHTGTRANPTPAALVVLMLVAAAVLIRRKRP